MGTDYGRYDADKDPRGDRGHALASLLYRRNSGSSGSLNGSSRGFSSERFRPVEGNSGDHYSVKSLLIAAIHPVGGVRIGEIPSHSAVLMRLEAIQNAGYPLNNYGQMSPERARRYLEIVRREVLSQARKSPSRSAILDRIIDNHPRLIQQERYLLSS